MAYHLGVIADDLTGANDTGVQFSKRGFRTVVVIDLADLGVLPGQDAVDVVVVDTESRLCPPRQAYRRVRDAADKLLAAGTRRIYKKIDSTLRGNIGAELDALMDATAVRTVLVAPAFPANRRTTVGGYQLWDNVPLTRTEVEKDPLTPVTEAHVPTLLAKQCRRRVGYVDLTAVGGSEEGLEASLRGLAGDGCEIIVLDALTQEHLAKIVAVGERAGFFRLSCGSAGLAAELPAVLTPNGSAPPVGRESGKPALVVAGSRSRVTRAQIALLEGRHNLAVVELDRWGAGAEVARAAEVAVAAARQGNDVALVAPGVAAGPADAAVAADVVAGTADAVDELAASVPEEAVRPQEKGLRDSRLVVTALGAVAAEFLRRVEVSGLLLTGGDTALAVCRALGAAGFALEDEINPGIPYGTLIGGPFHGLTVVTKAGSFGGPAAVAEALGFLSGIWQAGRRLG